MRLYILALLIALSGVADARKGYPVGVGRVRSPKLMAATATGGSLTVNWVSKTINADGSCVLVLAYSNAGSVQVSNRVINVDAACTVAKDQIGNIVAQPPPSAFCTSLASEVSQTNSLISTAASAGRLNL